MKEDICNVCEVYNTNTKGMYKLRCLVHIKELGDVIILKRPLDMINELKKSVVYGFGRKN